MSQLSNLLLVQADPRLGEGVRFAFEREGARVTAVPQERDLQPVLDRLSASDRPQLVVVAGASAEAARTLLGAVRSAQPAPGAIPVLYLGNGIHREEALAAGASEYLPRPAYLRDVVVVGRLLASAQAARGGSATGQLDDYFGLYYLLRALWAARRTGVLTLVRGLRRGELRLHDGAVSSAQVGPLHGMAALHQLLLWSQARLELRTDVQTVARRQLPLAPEALLVAAREFLDQVDHIAGEVGAEQVLVCDDRRRGEVMQCLPPPVHKILDLFDGKRSVADVVEDGQYRLIDTLALVQRLHEVGLVREPTLPAAGKGRGGRRKRRRGGERGAEAGMPWSKDRVSAVDWAALVPSSVVEASELSLVVPASEASGEIVASAAAGGPAAGAGEPAAPGAAVMAATAAGTASSVAAGAAEPAAPGAVSASAAAETDVPPLSVAPVTASAPPEDTSAPREAEASGVPGVLPVERAAAVAHTGTPAPPSASVGPEGKAPAPADPPRASAAVAPAAAPIAGALEAAEGTGAPGQVVDAAPASPGGALFSSEEEAFFRHGARLSAAMEALAVPEEQLDEFLAEQREQFYETEPTVWQSLWGRIAKHFRRDEPG